MGKVRSNYNVFSTFESFQYKFNQVNCKNVKLVKQLKTGMQNLGNINVPIAEQIW